MKKIININLSGRVIPIEDSAYEKLQAYIESLRRYFAHEEGRDEIINDIESRIAELMNDKIRKGASHITDIDIEEIAQSMGRPQDFDAEAAENPNQGGQQGSSSSGSSSSSSTAGTRSKGRLYRDTSDKFIGGVCSGIGAYMNVDPAIVRILAAILTFGGFGLGFLVYILLWIILPPKDLEGYTGKRLYRNPDDRIIGGVAGGLAAYFGKSTTTIRLIFVAPIFLSIILSMINGIGWRGDFDLFPNIFFGSLSSTFILAYVILWIVLPVAHSAYEKMEMRGEKVDVNAIRQNMKDRIKTWSDEVKESAQSMGERAKEFASTRGKTFADEVSDTTRRRGGGIGHAIGVIFKVFFLFIFGSIAFALFVGLIVLIFSGVAWWPVNNFLWTSKWQQFLAWGTLIFFLFVPLLGFMIWLFRRITRVRSRSNYLGWIFGSLWAIGWIAAIFFSASVVKDFREFEAVKTPITLDHPIAEKMVVAVSQSELEYTGRFDWISDGDEEGWDLSNDTLTLSTLKFNVKSSPDSAYHVTMIKTAYGNTREDARERADKIQYTVYSRDSILDLGNGYAIGKENKFRGQQVEILIQVPAGKKIRFDESIINKLNPAEFRIRRRHGRRRNINIEINDYRSFRFLTNIDYVMGVDGELTDPTGKSINYDEYRNEDDYRYNDTNTDSARLQQELEREKRRKEKNDLERQESEKKIRDLEQKLKEKQKTSSIKLESMDDNEGGMMSGTPSTVLSIVSWTY